MADPLAIAIRGCSLRSTPAPPKMGGLRVGRVSRSGRPALAAALGVVSTVCAVACQERNSISTSKAAPLTAALQASSTGDVSAGETPAAKQFAAWLTAFNSGDRGALVAYHQQYFPYEVASEDVAGIDRELALSQGTGGFHLEKTENPASTSVVAILKERHSMQFARATMDVDAAEPHRVVRFVIHPSPTPDEFLPPKPAGASVSAGETPAGRQFAAWLSAFNSGDRAALVAYHQQYFPYEVASEDVAGIDREFGLSRGTGGFDLKKPETPAPTSIVAMLKERRSAQFARVKMEVDAAEPHRVVRFEIHPVPTPDEFLTADERKSRVIDDARRRSLTDGIAKELQAHYITPDVATRMIAALRDHLAHGDYDKITSGEEFASTVTRDLREVSHDLHLRLVFGRHPRGPEPSLDDQRAMARSMNYGFGPIDRMSGNIAHVVINGFPRIVDDDSRKAVGDLMSQVADADALVVDLRNNGGGSPETVALIASYLFDATPVHLNDMFWRDAGSVQQSWTVRDLRGTRFGGQKPVYVLTSKRTFSGGEEFTYDLQALHRAKIVGETTGGGAHPVGPRELDEWFTIMVPSGRPINPVTRTNWEGTGVVPDVAVSADAALEEAHRRAIADVASKAKRPARP